MTAMPQQAYDGRGTRWRNACALAAGLLLVAAAPHVAASVFSRFFGRSAGGTSAAERLVGADGGAERVLRRRALVNGTEGELSVWKSPDSAEGEAAICFSSDSPASSQVSSRARWNVPDVPEPAGLVVSFDAVMSSASSDSSGVSGAAGTKICSGGAAAGQSPEAVLFALRSALEAGGWTEAEPAGGVDGLSIWRKRDAIALAWAGVDSHGDALWLLLRRQ